MISPPINDDLAKSIQKALNSEIERVVREEAAAAATRAERRVREMTTAFAATVLQRFDMEFFGNKLVVKVDFNTPPK